MRCRRHPVLPKPASRGMTGDSLSVLAASGAGRDDHRLDTLVSLENKAEGWR
jgi:hypothetical protein